MLTDIYSRRGNGLNTRVAAKGATRDCHQPRREFHKEDIPWLGAQDTDERMLMALSSASPDGQVNFARNLQL